jgi:hypothetical protein
MLTSPKTQSQARQIIGRILSQLLNVPVLSGLLITFLYYKLPPETPNRLSCFYWAFFFLCLLPLSSLFFYIPGKTKDWEKVVHRQRTASFVLMIISYPIGAVVLYVTHAPVIYEAMTVVYSFVTVGLIVFNLFFHYKASGHAAGVAGPVAAMIYIYGAIASPLIALLPLVTWARLAAKGHNFWQTVVGATLSLAISVCVLFAFGFTPFHGLLF